MARTLIKQVVLRNLNIQSVILWVKMRGEQEEHDNRQGHNEVEYFKCMYFCVNTVILVYDNL